ncbi:DUF4381 domain-containing protein [Lysobacter sp. S4-A87]|uniref:DUF4381 family protein n=1 Tax=Lysobacter sp. S4-A87 TaxID=2925843 RepID=UPI001F5339EC|nr:DUF4381 family protein [Lysobacter sp. S4-A87]UNK50904.1 DUF4381 domain-containing protein [Lysobacter sp. S4-A87]
MGANALVLRDIHSHPAPPWWPPAPGWWLLAAAVLLLCAAVTWAVLRRRSRRRAITELFDRSVDAAGSPAAQVAAMSELLRRAARRHDADADRLQGEAWLAFLDAGSATKPRAAANSDFSRGHGRLLLDGGYRRDVTTADVHALRPLARSRFLQWMGAA